MLLCFHGKNLWFSGEIWDDQLRRSFRTQRGAIFERIQSGQWVQQFSSLAPRRSIAFRPIQNWKSAEKSSPWQRVFISWIAFFSVYKVDEWFMRRRNDCYGESFSGFTCDVSMPVSIKLTSIDSSWKALQFGFWVRGARIEHSAAKSRKPSRSHLAAGVSLRFPAERLLWSSWS